MKKKILPFLSFIAFSFVSFAEQPFASVGTTWYYNFNGFTSTGYCKIECTDTLIYNGKLCSQLEKTVFNFSFAGYDTFPLGNEYIYQDSNRVLIYKYGAFRQLYDLNAQPGDTVSFVWDNPVDPLCDTIGLMTIDSIGSITINGININYQSISYVDISYPGWPIHTRIYEKIGMENFLLFSHMTPCDSAAIYDGDGYGPLRCYFDSILGAYQHIPIPCDYIISIEEIISGSINIFPNPVLSEIFIQSSGEKFLNSSFQLYDLMGEKILSGRLTEKNNRVDLSEFSSGIYFISIVTNAKMITRKIIKL